MTALQIALFCVGYVVVWVLFTAAFNAFLWHPNGDADEIPLGALIGMIWPPMLVLTLIFGAVVGIGWIATNLEKLLRRLRPEKR